MEKCNQPAEKRIKGILDTIVVEECGCKAKHHIYYELNGKEVVKLLCGKHYNSVTSWLNRISVPFQKFTL